MPGNPLTPQVRWLSEWLAPVQEILLRAWAQANKMDVPARGRIPKKVYEAFGEAQ